MKTKPLNYPFEDFYLLKGMSEIIHFSKSNGARGSAWLERTADNREALGSNPSGPIYF